MQPGEFHWEMFLRGAVVALLLLHLIHLALPGARPAARAALALFTLSLLAYVLCQQADVLLSLPRPLGVALMALCVSGTAWLWVAARALFDDGFSFTPSVWGPALAMVVLGLTGHLPRLLEWTDGASRAGLALEPLHGAAMLAFTAAALWEIVRGWRDDLVEPRRVARRWGAMGIGVYAAVAVVVELAVRDRPVGRLLPAVHIAGIGAVTLALAVLMARRSLDEVLGVRAPAPDEPAPAADAPVAVAPPVSAPPEPPVNGKAARALERLMHAMTQDRLYRREGLTLTALAQTLGVDEALLRRQINQHLGYRNFNDFLHHYRLQEAAERLAHEDLPVLTIALECGYGSIGPFNRAFKQRFGMTPSEYRGGARLPRATPA
jgi:AraC-like DNA-binding protein